MEKRKGDNFSRFLSALRIDKVAGEHDITRHDLPLPISELALSLALINT